MNHHKKGVRRRLLTIGSGEVGIGVVLYEVADDRSDGELGVGQAENEVRGLSGIDGRHSLEHGFSERVGLGFGGGESPLWPGCAPGLPSHGR
jgi:hypothetical protein